MFHSLPHTFKKYKLSADARTLILLVKCMDKGLVKTTGDLYLTLQKLVCTSEQDYGPYSRAFYEYFFQIDILPGETLQSAIARSDAFNEWKQKYFPEDMEDMPDMAELTNQYLDHIHLSQYDIRKWVSGKDILAKDDAKQQDENPNGDTDESAASRLEKGADYNDVDIDELLKRMRQVAEQQQGKHTGGSHWLGTGGMSPYGHSGAAKGGIRVGGSSSGKMARAVIEDARFYPVNNKEVLSDNTIDAAFASLKGIEELTPYTYLDIPNTIKEGLKQGGIFLPIEKEKDEKKTRVILLIDNGGMSMWPYIKAARRLFSKMDRRFAHDLKTYYFHNTLYNGAFTDERRRKFETIDKICSLDKRYVVFVIGDADMAPYEISNQSYLTWQKLIKHFPKTVWLNPLDIYQWKYSHTVNILKSLIKMFPLSAYGIEKAVRHLNSQSTKP